MIFPLSVIAVLLVLVAVLGFLLYKCAKRLLEFDDLFELFVHDLETNVKYFSKLADTPVFSNSPEIMDMHKNVTIMRDRMIEYVMRMEELAKRRLRKPEKKRPGPPPVVI